MDEFSLIKKYFAPLADHPASLGLNDDAALVDVPEGQQLVITKDAINQGVHFIGSEDPALIAKKLLRVNLSDLAAMGATPYLYFLALMLPHDTSEEWIEKFAEGLEGDQALFNIRLGGGDTTATKGTLSLSVTALGLIPQGQALKRSGAKAGDAIFVSGTIGDSALGLALLKGDITLPESMNDQSFLETRYFLPKPRIALGQELRGIARSCMDISDGLLQDLGHICDASTVGASIDSQKLPLSLAAQEILLEYPELRLKLLTGGDDYELLFTVPPEKLSSVPEGCTQIGWIKEGNGIELRDGASQPITIPKGGYSHFSND